MTVEIIIFQISEVTKQKSLEITYAEAKGYQRADLRENQSNPSW